MASLTAIREALRVRLATISGLRTYAVMPIKPELPAAGVALHTAAFNQDMDGNTKYEFYIWVYVSASDLNRAQSALDAYLETSGAQSVKAAIEGDQSLGGIVDYVTVTGWTQAPSLVLEKGIELFAIPLDCEVMA